MSGLQIMSQYSYFFFKVSSENKTIAVKTKVTQTALSEKNNKNT